MKLNDFFNFFILELILNVIISTTLIFLTYFINGSTGVEALVDGLSSLTNFANLTTFIVLFIISLCLFFFKYYFNFKHKSHLAFLANQLFDYCLGLLRISGGFLIAFTILYLVFEGTSILLSKFIFWGILAIIEVSIFSCLRHTHENPIHRPIY